MQRLLSTILTLIALGCCAFPTGCAAFGSGRVSAGDRTLVRLYDAKNDLLLELANVSHPELSDIYSTTRSSASLKLAGDDAMGDLLDAIDRSSFPLLATSGTPQVTSDVRGLVVVEDDGDVRSFGVPLTGATAEQLKTFATLKELIAAFYQATGGLQSIDNPVGSQLFEGRRR